MPEETNCEEHGNAITELKTTISNGRWIMGVVGSLGSLVVMFTGWVANDHLSGIRGDLKEAKGMLQSIQRDTDRLGLKVQYLEAWKSELDEQLKARKR